MILHNRPVIHERARGYRGYIDGLAVVLFGQMQWYVPVAWFPREFTRFSQTTKSTHEWVPSSHSSMCATMISTVQLATLLAWASRSNVLILFICFNLFLQNLTNCTQSG
jgi:hypothetical protein